MQPDQRGIKDKARNQSQCIVAGQGCRPKWCAGDFAAQLLPRVSHLALPPAVDEARAEGGKDGKGAEQDKVRQITIRNGMGGCPEHEGQKQGVAVQTNDTRAGGVELGIQRAAKGERIRPRDGQRQDQSNRQHGHQRHIELPRRPVPQRHKRRPARCND